MRGLGRAAQVFGVMILAGVTIGSITSGLPPFGLVVVLAVVVSSLVFGGAWMVRRGAVAS